MPFRADVVGEFQKQMDGFGEIDCLRVMSTPTSDGPGVAMFTLIPREHASAIGCALVAYSAAN